MKALAFGLILLAACAELSTTDKATIAADGVRISVCQELAHACKLEAGDAAATKCWPIYDDCMTRAGLKDAGHE